jgi:hypothetical protein
VTPTSPAIVLYVDCVDRNQNANVSGTFLAQNALFRYKLSTAPDHAVNLALASPSLYTVASSAGVVPSFSRSYGRPSSPLLLNSPSGSNRYHSAGFSMHRPPSGPSESALHAQITLPTLEFEFSGHAMQAPLPFVALYVPAAHAVQATPSAPVYPGLHTHHALPATDVAFDGQTLQTLALPAAETFEYAPAGQFVHDALPLTFLYFPTTQELQAPPSGPVYPMIHMQLDIFFGVSENGDLEFAGHALH